MEFRTCAHCGREYMPKSPKSQAPFCARPDCVASRAKERKRIFDERVSAQKQKTQKTRKQRSGAQKRAGHKLPILDRTFVGWDGEGEDGKYTLLACSDSAPLVDRNGLTTKQCLDYMLERPNKDKVHVWFSFGYDIAMILHDIPVFPKTPKGPSLLKLKQTTRVRWEGYSIFYIPRKIFRVRKGALSFSSYDVFSFFGTSFERMIEDWTGEVPALLKEGKLSREIFRDWSMEKIIQYNALELELLVDIMDKLRGYIKRAGLSLTSYHGPGALASWWLGHVGFDKMIKAPSLAMEDAVQRAYIGARVDDGGWGYAANIWHFDINSAYPYAFSKLPDLSKIERWDLVENDNPISPYDLCFCEWELPFSDAAYQWGPFPFRCRDHSIIYPFRGSGWYWGIEVLAALRRFPSIRVVKRWTPIGELQFPLKPIVEEFMEKRLALKKAGDPANIPLKLCANSWYGKCAQKVGYTKNKPPRFRSLIYAGWVTAHARAQLSDAIHAANDAVILVMTDSIFSLVDLRDKLDVGSGLGQWEYDKKTCSGIFVGAGLYQAYDTNHNPITKEFKSRGFEGGLRAVINYEKIVKDWEGALKGKKYVPHEFPARRFVGISLATLNEKYAAKLGQFIDFTKELKSLPFFGDSKRLPEFTHGSRIYTQNGSRVHFQYPTSVEDVQEVEQNIFPVSSPYVANGMESEAGDDFTETLLSREDEGGW